MTVGRDYFHHAVGAFDQQNYDQAVKLARLGLKHAPDDASLWQMLGISLWLQADLQNGQEALENATCLAPLSALGQLALGQIYARQGKTDLARTIFAHLAGGDVCPTPLLNKLASACGQIGEYELALHVCRVLNSRLPDHHGALFGIAYYLTRLGHPLDEVVIPLSLAMDLAPEMLSYRINLACVWTDLGEIGKAYDLLKEIAVDQVDHPCWLRKMALVFKHFDDLVRLDEVLQQMETVESRRGTPSP